MKYGYGEVKNVPSEVWLRRSEKRFERSEVTEKKKAREQQLENEEENSFCFVFFSLSNNCVFVWLKLQERAKKYIQPYILKLWHNWLKLQDRANITII